MDISLCRSAVKRKEKSYCNNALKVKGLTPSHMWTYTTWKRVLGWIVPITRLSTCREKVEMGSGVGAVAIHTATANWPNWSEQLCLRRSDLAHVYNGEDIRYHILTNCG